MTDKIILLVEDNPDDVELTRRAFKKANITNELVVATDGQEALDILFGTGGRTSPLVPVVTLLDLNLPRIGGLDVLRRVRENPRTSHIPIVALTSSKEESDLIQSYNLGVNSYIRKPVDFGKFVEAIQTLQLYWTVLNEPPPEAGTASA